MKADKEVNVRLILFYLGDDYPEGTKEYESAKAGLMKMAGHSLLSLRWMVESTVTGLEEDIRRITEAYEGDE